MYIKRNKSATDSEFGIRVFIILYSRALHMFLSLRLLHVIYNNLGSQ